MGISEIPERPDQPPVPGKTNAKEKLVQAAISYLEEHYMEKFSLQALSQALFVDGSYLLRVFKARTGKTLLWYHHYIRCEKAKALLADKDMSISRAGEAAGFVSSSHFSHIFKKMTGLTPSEYQKRAGG